MLIEFATLFNIVDNFQQDIGCYCMASASIWITPAVWTYITPSSRTFKEVVYAFPDWYLICGTFMVLDGSSLIKLSCCCTSSAALRCYMLTCLFVYKDDLNSELPPLMYKARPAFDLVIDLAPSDIETCIPLRNVVFASRIDRYGDLSFVRLVVIS
ncbi:unnamed protein product, partial [Clonostachys chloroleuca]